MLGRVFGKLYGARHRRRVVLRARWVVSRSHFAAPDLHSNRRIATELFVSVGTVKTHINNVYRKLDAHSRTHAVARARELDLI
ncbi:MAG TPA: LuxR C-terminal-related transcriptional regulator [Rubrobacteraceae bacterium]|jgi:regulatory LuxR family protein|nr:LuxR C-terminal-related transcriptional regulator [Rubrobacteraceae bacterium]